MKNLTVKQRLVAMVAGGILALVLFGIIGVTGMQTTLSGLNSVYLERVMPVTDLKKIADDYADMVVDSSHKVRNGNITWQEGIANLDISQERTARLWQGYLAGDLDPREQAIVDELTPSIAVADTKIGELRGIFAAEDMAALTQFTVTELYPAITPVSEGFSNLVEIQLQISAELYESAAWVSGLARNSLIILLLLAIVGFTLIARWLVNSIGAGLDAAVAGVDRLAAGELGTRIVAVNNDEIGQLVDRLNHMSARLCETVDQVNSSALAINNGAREIATGNIHLSERTEDQAANLEETAASMEQMTATVRQNAQNAAQASGLAAGARDDAEQGATVVAGARAAMNEINQSSQKIADITGVVDEIAFQTNLLALNAAVEAARAGDAGRGFAVVASEVRVLAQRSAEAAKQIKELIEESTGKVADGSRLVQESEQTLNTIVDSIKQVSTTVAEISASSTEQSDGIEQVNAAVTQMDQSTQQNAALVEQAAASAKDLEHQAQQLDRLMAFFSTTCETPAGAQPLPAPSTPPQIQKPPMKAVTAAPKREANDAAPRPATPISAARRLSPAGNAAPVSKQAVTKAPASPRPSAAEAPTEAPLQTPLRANASAADPDANWEEF